MQIVGLLFPSIHFAPPFLVVLRDIQLGVAFVFSFIEIGTNYYNDLIFEFGNNAVSETKGDSGFIVVERRSMRLEQNTNDPRRHVKLDEVCFVRVATRNRIVRLSGW